MGPCGNCCALVVLTALALPVDASAETTTPTIDPWIALVTPNIAAPCPQLRISGEVAYVHSDQDALDTHYFTFGHDPANGDGQGFQLEGVLSYNPTQAFNVGVGGQVVAS